MENEVMKRANEYRKSFKIPLDSSDTKLNPDFNVKSNKALKSETNANITASKKRSVRRLSLPKQCDDLKRFVLLTFD